MHVDPHVYLFAVSKGKDQSFISAMKKSPARYPLDSVIINPLSPNINIHILLTILLIFLGY